MTKKNLIIILLALIIVGAGIGFGMQKTYGFAPVQTQNQVTTINSSGTNYLNTSSTVTNLVNVSSTIAQLPSASLLSDSISNPTTSEIASNDLVWNPLTMKWERMRGGVGTFYNATATITGMTNTLPQMMYTSGTPTLTEGQYSSPRLNTLAYQINDIGTAIRGERFSGGNNDLLAVVQENTFYTSSTGNVGTVLVKSGAGHLHELIIPTPVANASIICYDSLTAAGTVLTGAITRPATLLNTAPIEISFDVSFATGLTCAQSAASQPFVISYH